MTTPQYGIWTNIFDYVGYFTIFSGMLPFWTIRFVARGKEGTIRTSTMAQLAIALASMIVYFPAIVLISKAIGTTNYLPIYLIAGSYIITAHLITLFESILQSTRPQAVGFGLLIEETVKVSVALVLILGFHELFLGAVLGLVLSCFAQVFYYVYLLRRRFREKVHWGLLKEWLKGSTVILYNIVGTQLMAFALILLFLYGSSDARAYYQAALSFTAIVGYASSLSFTLYPKLLAKTCSDEQVGLSFQTVMMLAIPFSALIMVMSFSFLTVLNTAYSVAWPVLVALTIDALVALLITFYNNCLMGAEHFDAEGKISIRELLKSKIFKVFTVPYIQAAIALPLIYFVLTTLPLGGAVHAALYVIAILIGVHLSSFVGLYLFMRRSVKLPVTWKNMAKYILASAAMAAVLFLVPTTTTLLTTIAKAIVGFLIYVGLLLAIDSQARHLVGLIWDEIKGSLQMLTSKNSGVLVEDGTVASEN